MATYKVITLIDLTDVQLDEAGVPVVVSIPAGTVTNRIEWDGETEFQPAPNTAVEKES